MSRFVGRPDLSRSVIIYHEPNCYYYYYYQTQRLPKSSSINGKGTA